MSIIHIHPNPDPEHGQQMQAIYAACLRALEELHHTSPTQPPARQRSR